MSEPKNRGGVFGHDIQATQDGKGQGGKVGKLEWGAKKKNIEAPRGDVIVNIKNLVVTTKFGRPKRKYRHNSRIDGSLGGGNEDIKIED